VSHFCHVAFCNVYVYFPLHCHLICFPITFSVLSHII
jgi:hypothetical protein